MNDDAAAQHDKIAEEIFASQNAMDVELEELKTVAETRGATNTVGIDGGQE